MQFVYYTSGNKNFTIDQSILEEFHIDFQEYTRKYGMPYRRGYMYSLFWQEVHVGGEFLWYNVLTLRNLMPPELKKEERYYDILKTSYLRFLINIGVNIPAETKNDIDQIRLYICEYSFGGDRRRKEILELLLESGIDTEIFNYYSNGPEGWKFLQQLTV